MCSAPVKVVVTGGAMHVVAAPVLLNGGLALRAGFRVAHDPVDVLEFAAAPETPPVRHVQLLPAVCSFTRQRPVSAPPHALQAQGRATRAPKVHWPAPHTAVN